MHSSGAQQAVAVGLRECCSDAGSGAGNSTYEHTILFGVCGLPHFQFMHTWFALCSPLTINAWNRT